MGKHDHKPPAPPCEHDVKHCAHCNVCYCVKCEQEWVTRNYRSPLQDIEDGLKKVQPRGPWYGNDKIMLCSHQTDARGLVHK